MWKKFFIGLGILSVVYVMTMYLVNPFDIKSTHPRARILGVDLFRIPARSMLPNLEVGNILVVSTIFKTPKRGDIVVFQFPQNPKIYYVKRLIGMSGDRISYRDKQLYINDKKLEYGKQSSYDEEKYQVTEKLDSKSWNILWHKQAPSLGFTVTVPEGKMFFMGDNRDNSYDSRYWGFVDESMVAGILVYKVNL